MFWISVNLLSSLIAKYCFGYEALDNGQSLVPSPPDKITGSTLIFEFSLFFVSAKIFVVTNKKSKKNKFLKEILSYNNKYI